MLHFTSTVSGCKNSRVKQRQETSEMPTLKPLVNKAQSISVDQL